MGRRNKRRASELAMERLKVPVVTDEDVLDVLRLWHFKSNRTRTNVFPAGANFVHSDTLGAIRNRVGKVVPTKQTVKNLAVFALLSRWLEDNIPDVFTQPFTFTSVNLNFGYAARPRRDQYHKIGKSKVGASGDYTGVPVGCGKICGKRNLGNPVYANLGGEPTLSRPNFNDGVVQYRAFDDEVLRPLYRWTVVVLAA